MRTALFPGTFDPFTLGHRSIVHRGLALFDRIVIAVGINDAKRSMFTTEERLRQIEACFEDEPRVDICSYEGLTVECARDKNAGVILRGIRSLNDFEYERLLADVNQKISGIETVCLFTEPEYACIQSNVVRDLLLHQQDVRAFVPEAIAALLKK
jgi:pantetheine-phosphate adenylyltransferase